MGNKRTFFSNRNHGVIWSDGGIVCSFQDRWSGGINPYQRREGREFDWYKPPAQKYFLANMNGKMTDTEFSEDIRMVLRQGVEYDSEKDWELGRGELVKKI
jgi:hypothetical protein